jgi:hypothetical protein
VSRRAPAGTPLVVFCLALGVAGRTVAQAPDQMVITGAPGIVPAPTETQYDAVSPNNVTGFSGNLQVAIACPALPNASADCNFKLSYNGAVTLDLTYQVVSRTGSGCQGGIALNTPTNLTATPVTLVGIQKTRSCTVQLQFRVRNLAYNAQQSPTAYLQSVTFATTKP